ncbi:MAG: leucine-rich repeat protein, partial [Bacilli bacterium]|nr:leucine-rich repeat protein [Bacilli bacterium]
MPEGITEISSDFEGPMTIDTLVLPKSLIKIETRAFYSIKINTLKVHDSIERIDESAFYSYIENIEIKNTYGNALYVLQKLKHFCRNSLTKLKTIRITEKTLSEKELIEIKKLFTENKNIKIINDQCVTNDENKRIKGLSRIKIEDELNIESTVEEIGSNAFSGEIFNLTLPENVKILSINAFEYNYIGILTIYDSLEKIGVNAFGINLNEIRIINRGKAFNVLKEIKRT